MAFWVRQLAKDKKKRKNHNHGFSLVELIIVIAIMAILAAAIAPALIRYIAKARKAVDIETAQTIFEAANLASTTSNDDAAAGWYLAADSTGNAFGKSWVTPNGHLADKERSCPQNQRYQIATIAWARGIDYNGWQNATFKATPNSDVTDINGKKQTGNLALVQAYVNEFLKNLFHDNALSETYHGAGNNAYDGKQASTMEFKYKQDAGMGRAECWLLCVNCNSYTPEVWIGDKRINTGAGGSTGAVRPLYRLYPDPCVEYKE
ncbi:MAG: prepilin-type N-terminal cleavage/methylation domain-containing protein [Eubacterium sp.]|nr:prepilin-type N-terminal cleavage/methylation domain-containing protein [Eubacterium sp.]